MGHIILLSELERARPARLRGPLPVGGATVSLFMGVRYERAIVKHEAATSVNGSFVDTAPPDNSSAPKPHSPSGRRRS